MKVVFAIRSLNIGGAERQFIELIKHINKEFFEVFVVSMYGGFLENEIKGIENIKYFCLDKKGRFDIKFYLKYKSLLKKIIPDIIYSWMGEMNLFSLWCKPKQTKLIWGFRASNMDLSKYGKFNEFLFNLQKFYSKKVDKIITNSYASIEFHKSMGFFMDRAVVIHNGIDVNRFRKWNNDFKEKYKFSTSTIIGIVARLDPMKGYNIFCQVANILKDRNLKFVSIGEGDKGIKNECNNVVFLGSFKEIEEVYNGIDILVSASKSEGFSNSIAEAMACEVPCVVTDVGDSKLIVGDCGIVVEPNSVEKLKIGIEEILKKDLKKLGKCSRDRIVKNFSIERMVQKTEEEICAVL